MWVCHKCVVPMSLCSTLCSTNMIEVLNPSAIPKWHGVPRCCRWLFMDEYVHACWCNGVWLKSKVPWSCAHDDTLGLSWDLHSRLSISLAWGKRQFQRCMGKSLSALQRPEIKWFLNVLMACSAACSGVGVVGPTGGWHLCSAGIPRACGMLQLRHWSFGCWPMTQSLVWPTL